VLLLGGRNKQLRKDRRDRVELGERRKWRRRIEKGSGTGRKTVSSKSPPAT